MALYNNVIGAQSCRLRKVNNSVMVINFHDLVKTIYYIISIFADIDR